MPTVFMHTGHFKYLSLVLLAHLAAWSHVWATECAANAHCSDFPESEHCLSNPQCCFSMPEEMDVGREVGNVKIVTSINDALANGTGTIALSGDNAYFNLNESTGAIILTTRVDRDTPDAQMCLEIAVSLTTGVSKVLSIGVIVEDINDNSPMFLSSPDTPFSWASQEGTDVNICIPNNLYQQLEATDVDDSHNGEIIYSLAGEASDKFEIAINEQRKSCIRNTVDLDREEVPDPSSTSIYPLRLILIARDNGTEPNQSNITFTINVTDINDNQPMFTESSLETVIILENVSDSVVIRDLNATDRDYNSQLTFSLENDRNLFSVDEESGKLSVSTSGVGLSPRVYNLDIVVSDGDPEHDISHTLNVEVQDVNENARISFLGIFLNKVKIESLQEEMDPSNITIIFRVDDDDQGNSYLVKLFGAHTENFTAIYEQKASFGLITVNLSYPIDQEALIRETESSSIVLVIELTELGLTTVTQMEPFEIYVAGINDNLPFLNKTEFEAEEEKIDRIGDLKGLDLDSGPDGEVETYCIVSAVGFPSSPSNLTAEFKHHNRCRQKTLLSPLLDREANIEKVVVTMNLTDGGNKSNLVNITIKILDINDNYPSFSEPFKFSFAENREPDTIGSVVASDADIGTNGEIVYELLTSRNIFSIDNETGEVRALVSFDRETMDMYTIRVKAVNIAEMAENVDKSNLMDEVEVEITITDVNDNQPEWETQSNTFTASSDAAIGTLVHQLTATDRDLNSDITYKLEPSTLFIVTAQGNIEVAANLMDQKGSHRLLLTASDGKYTTPRNVTINVEEPPASTSSQVAIIASVVSAFALVVFIIVVMAVVLVCVFLHNRRHSMTLSKRNSRMDTDGVSSPTRGILRQIPSSSLGGPSRTNSATSNGRGVKFETTVQKFGYDHEHAVNNNSVLYVTQSSIHLDSSGSGDESPVTPPRLSTTSHHQNGKLPLDGHSRMSNGAPCLPPIQENFMYHPHHQMRHTHPIPDDGYSDEDSEGNSDDDSTLPDNASSTNAPLPSVRHLSRMAPSPHSTSPNSHLLPMPQISPSHQFSRSPEHSTGLNPPRIDELSIHSTSSDSLTDTLAPVHAHLAHENQRLSRPQGRSSYPVHMPDGYLMPPSSSSRYGRDPFMDRFRGTDFEDTSTYASAELDEALHFRPDQEPGIFSLTATSSYDEESQL